MKAKEKHLKQAWLCVRLGLILLILIGLLTACETARSNDLAIVNAPTVIVYDTTIQKRVADEIESGLCPAMTSFVIDYKQLRDEVRAVFP